jgi:hypothetical protein
MGSLESNTAPLIWKNLTVFVVHNNGRNKTEFAGERGMSPNPNGFFGTHNQILLPTRAVLHCGTFRKRRNGQLEKLLEFRCKIIQKGRVDEHGIPECNEK